MAGFVLPRREGSSFPSAKILSELFEYRVDGLIGPEPSDGTVMTVLNRILEYNKETKALTYEADPRRCEAVVRQLRLENPRAAVTAAAWQVDYLSLPLREQVPIHP